MAEVNAAPLVEARCCNCNRIKFCCVMSVFDWVSEGGGNQRLLISAEVHEYRVLAEPRFC